MLDDKKIASAKYIDISSLGRGKPIEFLFNELKRSLNKVYSIKETSYYTCFTLKPVNNIELVLQKLFNTALVNTLVRAITESMALSSFKHFTQKLLGKASLQSFVDRSTRQSYKLLPEF